MGLINYTEEQEKFRKDLREYAKKEITPNADQWEADHIVPKSAWKKMGAAGFLCTTVPKEYGGRGLDFVSSAIAVEEMVKTLQSGLMTVLHSDVVVPYIQSFGSEAQKKKYLPGCVSGDIITAVAMTEPDVGSDLSSLQTTAVEDGDEVVLNGTKTFISNGINCGLVIVAAQDPAIENKYAAVSLYIVEDGTPGFERGKHLEKMGMHSQDTAELFFTDCRIPKSNVLGEKGNGFIMLMQKLQQERLVSAIGSVAAAEFILDKTMEYCKETKIGGKPLCKGQAIQFALVEMATRVRMNRLLVDNLTLQHAEGKDVTAETMMAKFESSEMVNELVDRCLDFYGNSGGLESNPLVRLFRDLRINTIFAGTTEIMKKIIAKSLAL
ncbi:acyl-CoA dehydrogenase family protein [bacterium]|nr:acyl-CoA dehydrogenase family protein [bacterium]